MIVEYEQADGSVQVRGYMMSDGPLSGATGAMVRGWHSKCYWINKKREAKGDAVTGRVVAGTPTGYEINELVLTRDDLDALGITPEQARERSTAALSARVSLLREVASGLGKGVGDAQAHEAFKAAEQDGPYEHVHHHRLEPYQLVAHLEYAHGIRDAKLLRTPSGLQDQHARLHVKQISDDIRAWRTENETEGFTRDWREQFTAELKGPE